MVLGTVKWFDQRKGFGFITDQSGQDYYVHFTGLKPETRTRLKEGTAVAFEPVQGEKGPKAVNVEVAEQA